MATSPRASAPTASSAEWTVVRPFGARAIPTLGATQGAEALFVQTFRLEEGERQGDPVRDLKALLNLRHTNVGRLKEVTEREREVTVVSPYVEGETLAALRDHSAIPLGVHLRILVDVLAGITAIHGVKDSKLKPLGIVHGEIAPANVVIGVDGVPKIIQLCGVHASPGAQGADTLGYLAPEILLADDAFDQRVDVYAVGVMLWEALSGSTLFPETNPGAIVTRHLSGRIRKATVPVDAPWAEGLIDVAQKAIATDPNARYATAAELANEIKRIAKTNLASTMKVSQLVKERGTEAIAARRSLFGLKASGVTPTVGRVAPKVPEAPKAPAVLKPVPAPSENLPTTQPVPTSIEIVSEDLSESAVKPAVRMPPPEPSAHDRVTMPTEHDRVTLPTPIPGEQAEEELGDFSDLALESEPPPPPAARPGPPPRAGKTEMNLASPLELVPIPQYDPPPAAPAFAPKEPSSPALVAAAPIVAAPIVDAPIAVMDTSEADDSFDAAPPDSEARKKRRAIVFIALGACGLILILGSIRACMKSGKPDDVAKPAPTATATAKPKPVETVATATAEPTATVSAEPPKPTDTTPPVDTSKPVATAEPPVATAAPPATTTKPTSTATSPTAKATGTSTAPTAKPTATGKKPKTYDPQGI